MALPSTGVDGAQKEQTVSSVIAPQKTPEFTVTLQMNAALAAVTDSVTAMVRVSGGA